ncbi:MAG: TlpA disulfide reductase family protein [Gammaproteobacteria bacterium]
MRLARLGALLLVLVAGCSPREEAPAAPAVSAFEATDTVGRTVDLALLHGNVVLLNAWATWCKPCREEIPFLSDLQSREASRGLRVVGVNVDEATDREGVLAAGQRLGIRYTVWLDPDARVQALMGTSAVPASVLIDRRGQILWRHVGVLRKGTPGFTDALESALAR